jgi:hypothetical protein
MRPCGARMSCSLFCGLLKCTSCQRHCEHNVFLAHPQSHWSVHVSMSARCLAFAHTEQCPSTEIDSKEGAPGSLFVTPVEACRIAKAINGWLRHSACTCGARLAADRLDIPALSWLRALPASDIRRRSISTSSLIHIHIASDASVLKLRSAMSYPLRSCAVLQEG